MSSDAAMPPYTLHPATRQDARLIYELRRAGLREYVAQLWGWDEAEQTARFAALFDPARYQVVTVDDRDIGAISVEWREREAFLADIEIAPEWRGRGLGTAIIGAVMAEAGQRGLPVALQVLQANPARRLYERLGFAVVGETATHVFLRTVAPLPDEMPIGLRRGIVRIAPHHPVWKALFAMEAGRIRGALGDRALSIEHVGSTAVAGLVAKPIIDIMVGVADLADAEEVLRALEGIGYERRPAGDFPGRLLLVRGQADVRSVHLSMAEPESSFWRDHILFRDCLRADPAVAAEYARLKQELAARFPEDRLSYTAGKEAFITGALAAASGWDGEKREDERGKP